MNATLELLHQLGRETVTHLRHHGELERADELEKGLAASQQEVAQALELHRGAAEDWKKLPEAEAEAEVPQPVADATG